MAREMNFLEVMQAFQPIAEALEQLGVEYHLGGSVVSSLHGKPRYTQDIDLVANLQPSHVRRFVEMLNQDYYIDESMIRDAIRQRSSFNAISFATSYKIDVFIPKLRAFDQDEIQHIQYLPLEEGERAFPVTSPEATVVRKLEWYEMGGRGSSRQWQDILGILVKKANALDLAYMERWARVLKVSDLLTQALEEAGLA